MLLAPYIRRQNDLMSFNPFRALEQMERSFFSDNAIGEFKTDIRDAGDEFVLEADLPGFKKEDVNIELEGDTLSICAERKSETKREDGGFIRQERSYGSFCRRFETAGVDTGALQASFENGVLTLHMPKLSQPETQTKRIEIQ